MKWTPKDVPNPSAVAEIQRLLRDLPEPLARSLVLRGIDTFEKARSFFRDTQSNLHDPFLMDGMQAAAERLSRAIQDKETVTVYGDYDADGVTSTALVTHFLRKSGVNADYYIPNRFEDGYGLHAENIKRVANSGSTLMVVVDCGTTAVEEAAYATELGLDLIICDHHTPSPTDPHAVAVLNPKREGCSYPNSNLSACGVAYKLVCAVSALNPNGGETATETYLELVAISTICDMIPLEGENRILAREGLIALRQGRWPSLRALVASARRTIYDINSGDVAFQIGPRLNAPGRMREASLAVELLLTDSAEEVEPKIAELNQLNNERRAQGAKVAKEATEQADALLKESDLHALVLHDANWHPGVLGIAATRVKDRFNRPTVLLTNLRGIVTGSARSIGSINIHDALTCCEDVLLRFGGHAAAAGMTLNVEDLDAFGQRLNAAVKKEGDIESRASSQQYDATLDIRQIDQRFMSILLQFDPFGLGNREPVFRVNNLKLTGPPRCVGDTKAHLKLNVRHKDGGNALGAIGFSMGDKIELLQSPENTYEALACVQENTFRGRTSIQLKLDDIRVQPD